jgi:hypothetical protein
MVFFARIVLSPRHDCEYMTVDKRFAVGWLVFLSKSPDNDPASIGDHPTVASFLQLHGIASTEPLYSAQCRIRTGKPASE